MKRAEKHGEKRTVPFPKHLRAKLGTDEQYLVDNLMTRPDLSRGAMRPLLYSCRFCSGLGRLHGRLNNYECHDCGGAGSPPIPWNELKGCVMNKKEQQAAWNWFV